MTSTSNSARDFFMTMPLRAVTGRLSLVVLSLLLLTIANVTAQDQDEVKPKAKLSKADLKTIRPLYQAAMEKGNTKSAHNKAVRKLRETLETWAEKKNVGSALGDTDAWNALHAEVYAAGFVGKKIKKPKTGLSVQKLQFKVQGESVEFEYALSVPKKYDPKKSWPVILCFHDRLSTKKFGDGKTYIKKVWYANKATKDVAEQFIIIAPTIGDTSKKTKTAASRPFKWFDLLHAFVMVRPLREVQQKFNVDVKRVYLDGSGRGANMALELATLFGSDSFAAVIARQGVMPKKSLYAGLAQIPTLLIHRAPHKKERGGAERAAQWAEFKKTSEDQKWNAEILEFEAPSKVNAKVLAGQIIDPVWDAAPQIAAFLKDKELQAYPTKMRIVTDNIFFRSGSYIKINGHDIGREKNDGAIDILFEIDKEANAIRVTGDGIYSLSFFLNDDVLDLDRPIQVFVNKIPCAAEIPARSVSAMIKSMQGRPFDTFRFKTTTVIIKVPTPDEQNAKSDDESESKEEDKG